MSLKHSEALRANHITCKPARSPAGFCLVSHQSHLPCKSLMPTDSPPLIHEQDACCSTQGNCKVSTGFITVIAVGSTKPLHHHPHHCRLRWGYRTVPRMFLPRLNHLPIIRNTCNFAGSWMVSRPACPGTSTSLMMDRRKLLPQECRTALGQGTRKEEMHMLGTFQGYSDKKTQVTSPTAGSCPAPKRTFGWTLPEGHAKHRCWVPVIH